MSSSSTIPKRIPLEITETNFNTSIELVENFERMNLKPFEEDLQWTNEYLLEMNITRRPFDFQIELVRSLITHENSIVCLRTGAGKTYISALLIKYYYLKKKKNNSSAEFLSFFFVPHRAIRDQQAQAIRQIGDIRVIACDDNSSVKDFLGYNHVIVCTPQKFVNCLVEKSIHWNEIDLLIFDECHNCIGNHPYSKIMELFSVSPPDDIRPRIFGLTASCGTKLTHTELIYAELADENKRKNNALYKLYELCATLNCFDVAIVKNEEHLKELNTRIPRPTDDRILTVQSLPFDEYLSRLKQSFETLLRFIASKLARPLLSMTDEQKLIETRLEYEKEKNFPNVILIEYMIMFVKRFHALTDLPLKFIFENIIKKLQEFYT